MSIYNEPIEWIKDSIESILEQSFTDFEFIIVNDNPERKDNEFILNFYKKRDERILLVKNEQNVGLTKSLNKAKEMALGKYVARMDADDISHPERFYLQYNFLESNPNIILCGSLIYLINEKGKKIRKKRFPLFNEEITHKLVLKNVIAHPTMFFRNEKYLRYNDQYRYAQDYDFSTTCLRYGYLANVNKYLLYYRISRQQIGSKRIKEQDAYANRIREKYIKYLLSNKYGVDFGDQSSLNEVWALLKKNPSDQLLCNIFVSASVYLHLFSFSRRVISAFYLKTSLKNRIMLLLR
ncbi:MAG: glycosyltransferase [Candidatus Atribacteria bacterium]|nr:glycosyltransferase [Candidatus Atribacteria bacterium]